MVRIMWTNVEQIMQKKCEVDVAQRAIENAHRHDPRWFGQSRYNIAMFILSSTRILYYKTN